MLPTKSPHPRRLGARLTTVGLLLVVLPMGMVPEGLYRLLSTVGLGLAVIGLVLIFQKQKPT